MLWISVLALATFGITVAANDDVPHSQLALFKDESFLENVVHFVEDTRRAQEEAGHEHHNENGNGAHEVVAPKEALEPSQGIPEPGSGSGSGNSTVHQADFRIETGLFFDLNKGDESDCEEEEEESKGKLKKLLFFLPSSTNSSRLNSTAMVSPSILINHSDQHNLFTSEPQKFEYDEAASLEEPGTQKFLPQVMPEHTDDTPADWTEESNVTFPTFVPRAHDSRASSSKMSLVAVVALSLLNWWSCSFIF